jgi:hypothetical protein
VGCRNGLRFHSLHCVQVVNVPRHQSALSKGLMTCVRGRCPCWPQAELFDAAEMVLLDTALEYISTPSREHLWAKIKAQSRSVRPRRRGYVLSTMFRRNRDGLTLLGKVVYYRGRLLWLLNQGVCPNIMGAHLSPSHDVPAWAGQRLHPGRPLQAYVKSPFSFGNLAGNFDLLLLAGAYPMPVQHMVGYAQLQRQWHRWHGRTFRRLWTGLIVRA